MKYIQTQIKTEVSQLISHAEPLIYFISLDCGTFEPPYTYHTLIRDIQARSNYRRSTRDLFKTSRKMLAGER